MRRLFGLQRGATQLGFLDILTVLILLGILLYAATLQMPVYSHHQTATPGSTGNATP